MTRAPGVTVGGQAVIEGVMMRAPGGWAVAVRRPDGLIEAVCHSLPRLTSRTRLAKWPFVRGVLVLAESLTLGFRALSWSAQKAVGEEEEPLTGRQLGVAMAVAIVFFLGLFIVLPALAAKALPWESSLGINLVEGVLRIVLFLAYIWAIGRSAEIRRVFQYHGAEHKSIFAYEAGDPLSVEAIQKYQPMHPRCGTNFLLIVMIGAVFVFSLLGDLSLLWIILSRLLLIPVIAGLAYEVIKLSTMQGPLIDLAMKPGLWLQYLTTGEPDDDQVEVAVASLLAALDADQVDEVKARGPVPPAALAALE